MKINGRLIVVAVAVGVLVVAAAYVLQSRGSDYVWEIVLGVIALSLLLGVTSTLLDQLIKRHVERNPKTAWALVFASFGVIVALLVYMANSPKSISGESRVQYVYNTEKLQFVPLAWAYKGTLELHAYWEASFLFSQFVEKNSGNEEVVKWLHRDVANDREIRSLAYCTQLFRDLTMYLVMLYVGRPFTTPEMEALIYRKEVWHRLGQPHDKIKGAEKTLEEMEGDLRENPFYELPGFMDNQVPVWRLPKGTQVEWGTDGVFSVVTVKNKYFRMRIAAHALHEGTLGQVMLRSSVLPAGASEATKGPFKRFDVMVFYDVEFSKLRAAYPKMRYYRQWAQDVCDIIDAKFAWGFPKVYDSYEEWQREEQDAGQ
jgi:hypothetical protein